MEKKISKPVIFVVGTAFVITGTILFIVGVTSLFSPVKYTIVKSAKS